MIFSDFFRVANPSTQPGVMAVVKPLFLIRCSFFFNLGEVIVEDGSAVIGMCVQQGEVRVAAATFLDW